MPVYSDGTFPNGAPVLTSAAGHTYKCNSFTSTPGAATEQIIDQNGAHSGALQYTDPITFTAELQFENSSVPEPVPAAVNSTVGVFVNVNIAGANRNCFITDATVSKPQRGPWTAQVSGQARVN